MSDPNTSYVFDEGFPEELNNPTEQNVSNSDKAYEFDEGFPDEPNNSTESKYNVWRVSWVNHVRSGCIIGSIELLSANNRQGMGGCEGGSGVVEQFGATTSRYAAEKLKEKSIPIHGMTLSNEDIQRVHLITAWGHWHWEYINASNGEKRGVSGNSEC